MIKLNVDKRDKEKKIKSRMIESRNIIYTN